MHKRFGYLPVVSQLHDANALEPLVGPYLSWLDSLGGERRSADDLHQDAPLLILVGTGGTERQILQLWVERPGVGAGPVILIAHPDHNSLAASLEVLARLQQEGAAGCVVFIDKPDDPSADGRLLAAVHDLEVDRALRASRLGLVGTPSDWLIASSPDARAVRTMWGPVVHNIQTATLREWLPAPDAALVNLEADAFVRDASRVAEPDLAQIREAVRVYLVLRRIVEAEELNALTVRCFDLVVKEQTTACYGLARLNDEGLIAGCEGDLVTTVGMLWVKLLLGQLPWMANVARVDEANDLMWLAHCTVPRTLVKEYAIRSHFESGLGVGIQGTFATGPMTLVRIGGASMEKIWIAEGNLVQTGDDEHLCRTQIQLQLDAGAVAELLRAPLGNHLVVVPGHHADRLRAWWKLVIQPRATNGKGNP
jgi:L-fucose isomerase-like protein